MKKSPIRIILVGMFLLLASTLLLFFVSCGNKGAEDVDGPKVEPDINKYLAAETADAGNDIYFPTGETGYRSSPAIIRNKDGSLDAWFTAPNANGNGEWIVYTHSEDEGKIWEDFKCVLQPTAGSLDSGTVSEPAVIKLGNYYYLGYTSATDIDEYTEGAGNHCFVARAESPEGPYEKWNGSGWGGAPVPIVYFDGPYNCVGAGNLSFVELDGILYLYYSWVSSDKTGEAINQMRVSTALAEDENWPQAIHNEQIAYKENGTVFGYDVKYVEKFGKFVAVGVDQPGSETATLSVCESNDGITFRNTGVINTDILPYIKSAGLAGSINGHIRYDVPIYLIYSYSLSPSASNSLATRISEITLRLSDSLGSEGDPRYLTAADPGSVITDSEPVIIAIYPDIGFQSYIVGEKRSIAFSTMDEAHVSAYFTQSEMQRLEFLDYDETIISFSGTECTPLRPGKTEVTARLDGLYTKFTVNVSESGESFSELPAKLYCFQPKYKLSLESGELKHIRAYVENTNGTVTEIYTGITYTDYDTGVITINEAGYVSPVATGKTKVLLSYRGFSCTVTVEVVS